MREQWLHTAFIVATVANAAPGRKKNKVVTPAMITPYRIGGDDERVTFKQMLALMKTR